MTSAASRALDGVVEARRVINNHVAEIAVRCKPNPGDLFDFRCECGDLRCDRFVELTISEYRETVPGFVRAHD